MAHVSQSAARLLRRRYGGAIADPSFHLPRPECKPASATTQCQAFPSDGSGHGSLLFAGNRPTDQPRLFFNCPYKRANFRDLFLVYDHTTGKTPVLVLCECGEIREFERFNRAIKPLDHYMVLTNVPEKLEEAIFL